MKQGTLTPVYHAIGNTLEEALEKAHRQIPPRSGRDYAISRVIDWGMQTGGFVPSRSFYVRVVEDEHSPFMT